MVSLSNVVNIYNTEVFDQIETFLDQKLMYSGSEHTKSAYTTDICDFFNWLSKGNKEVKYLQIKDIQLDDNDIIKYQRFLIDKGLVSKSINRKVSTINQIYDEFYSNDYVQNLKPFKKAKRLKEGKNLHGVLEIEEVWEMARLVMEQPRGRKKLTKYYLLLFSVDTCLRKSALLNLKWSDFIVRHDDVEIKAIDKGNEEQNKIISKSFYEELLQIKDVKVVKNENFHPDQVFKISNDAIQEMMNYLSVEMKFDKERNIVFHSLRKAGVTFQYRLTNDIMQAKKAAGHHNVNTTQDYVASRDYGVLGAISGNVGIGDKSYLDLSHEELIEVIESLNKDMILLINRKIKELHQNKTIK